MYEDKFRRFSALVARADKALLRAKAMNVRSFGLRGVHVSCLLELLEHPDGLTSGELAGMTACLLVVAAGSGMLYGFYRFTRRKVYAMLGI